VDKNLIKQSKYTKTDIPLIHRIICPYESLLNFSFIYSLNSYFGLTLPPEIVFRHFLM
jgi:hypothetical protein